MGAVSVAVTSVMLRTTVDEDGEAPGGGILIRATSRGRSRVGCFEHIRCMCVVCVVSRCQLFRGIYYFLFAAYSTNSRLELRGVAMSVIKIVCKGLGSTLNF